MSDQVHIHICESNASQYIRIYISCPHTFHAEKVPEGSVWYNLGDPSGSKPTSNVDIPKGLTPPLCVYLYRNSGNVGNR